MEKITKVQATERPLDLSVDEFHVYAASNIVEVATEDGTAYEFDLAVYEKDEYILERFDKQKFETDLAIVQLSTLVIGGIS